MKSLGYALLFSGLVGGAIVLCKVLSAQAAQECASKCPDYEKGLKTLFAFGPLTLQLCSCGKVDSNRGEL